MNKEERKNILLTLPIETLVDLIIAGDEIEQRVFKAIKYIENHKETRYVYEPYGTYHISGYYDLLEILKGKDNEL